MKTAIKAFLMLVIAVMTLIVGMAFYDLKSNDGAVAQARRREFLEIEIAEQRAKLEARNRPSRVVAMKRKKMREKINLDEIKTGEEIILAHQLGILNDYHRIKLRERLNGKVLTFHKGIVEDMSVDRDILTGKFEGIDVGVRFYGKEGLEEDKGLYVTVKALGAKGELVGKVWNPGTKINSLQGRMINTGLGSEIKLELIDAKYVRE